MLIATGAYLKANGGAEKAHSQFEIAQKIMDAFSEDFLEDRWFTGAPFGPACEQREKIQKLLSE
jgi:hypothetical protein